MSQTVQKTVQKTVQTEPNTSPIKRALRALEDMQAKLQAITYAQREPIAILGMGCRFPGGADSPKAFWQLLEQGVDAVGQVPPQRWDVEAYYDADPDAPGKVYTREGGYLSEIDSFDAPFFGISAREASSLDPQQRLLLEISWEALEQANQASERVFNSTTGVFVGICSNDYNKMIWELGGAEGIDAFCATGNALSLAAGRLSYALGLKGPSMAVDTACSSSLVALHLACQNLRNRECDLAIAGGVNLLLTPDSSIAFSRTRMIDPSGRCRTFDADASGYVRGEGGGVVVLKRLSDAQRDGDNILAVVQGSAVNHNGRSSSLVAPNGPAQQTVIRQALEMSGADPDRIDYVEVQGTGTTVGQSLEVGALTSVLGGDRSSENPLYIGSVKTNMGHLEGASGIASLIKTVLALQHQTIPPHLHFQKPNPHIDWNGLPVKVPTQALPWPQRNEARMAAVNCFGFGGTNTHVILSEPPTSDVTPSDVTPSGSGSSVAGNSVAGSSVTGNSVVATSDLERPLHLLTLSAKNATSLQGLAERFHHYLEANPNRSVADVCFSANTGRAHFQHRLAIVAASTQELSEQLAAFSQQPSASMDLSGMVWCGEVKRPPKFALAFPGTGVCASLGRKLYDTQPIFRAVLGRAQLLLKGELSAPLIDLLYPERPADATPSLSEPETRVASFAIEYGLYQLWKSWGVEPTLLLGDGIGEYVAACAAGVFNFETGLKLSLEPTQLPAGLNAPRCPLGSLATGQLVTGQVNQAEYWRDRPVTPQSQPAPAPHDILAEHDISAVLIMGPATTTTATTITSATEIPHFASLHPNQTWQTLMASLSSMYTLGAAINWVGFDQPYPRRPLALPTYAWRRKRYWFDDHDLSGVPSQTSLGFSRQLAATDTTTLTQQLAATEKLSEAELALVPKLLSLISQQNNANGCKPPEAASQADFKTLTAEDIQTWLVNQVAQELGVDPSEINPQAPFDSYGLDSVLAIGIASSGKQHLGVEVTPLMLVQYPSIASLSKHLIAEFEAADTEMFEL